MIDKEVLILSDTMILFLFQGQKSNVTVVGAWYAGNYLKMGNLSVFVILIVHETAVGKPSYAAKSVRIPSHDAF